MPRWETKYVYSAFKEFKLPLNIHIFLGWDDTHPSNCTQKTPPPGIDVVIMMRSLLVCNAARPPASAACCVPTRHFSTAQG